MKHTKIFFALLALAVAVLAFGCKQANGSSSFTMNDNQKKAYESMITGFETTAAAMDIPAKSVKMSVESFNTSYASINLKVTDTQADKPIAKGTKADALRKRFVPSGK